jgi:hypothetical protein
VPEITLVQGEKDVKDRIIGVEVYDLTICFKNAGERDCYAYAAAVYRALGHDPTLGGTADRALVTRKKYIPPKNPSCGDRWELALTLLVTMEGAA